jgi:hypothetical protein
MTFAEAARNPALKMTKKMRAIFRAADLIDRDTANYIKGHREMIEQHGEEFYLTKAEEAKDALFSLKADQIEAVIMWRSMTKFSGRGHWAKS